MNTRDEIDQKYKWDLSDIYTNKDKWQSDCEQVLGYVDKILQNKGKLSDSLDRFLETIELELEVERKMENIYTYAKMTLDENTSDGESQKMLDKAETISVEISEKLSFIVPEILNIGETTIKSYLDSESMKDYIHYIEKILRQKPHILSEEYEKLLASVGEIASAPENIYSMLNDADISFPEIEDEAGNTVEITHGNFIPLMESSDRQVRKSAFKGLYSVYGGLKNTFASSLSSEVKKNNFYSKVRKYDSALEASLFGNNIPVEVYENLIETVGENISSMHDYISLRKKALDLEEIHFYDLYTPMVSDLDMSIEYDKARTILVDSLKIMGDEYVSIVKEGLESNWIDVYENKGKRSGAYSFGTYDSKPYILMNYHNTLDNVFTLAHEMGHSVHSYYTRKSQPYVYGDYSIFLAEIASTVNEAILIDHLLKNTEDTEERKYYLNHYLEQFRGTIYRQTMFAEFEKIVHEKAKDGQALTADSLSEIYSELNKKYYGEDIVLDEEIKYEWARIPHFYYNFYVYQYATGFSAAIYFAKKIIAGDLKAREDYIEFLKSGSSDYPIEILKKAGLDMTKKAAVEESLSLFSELIEEYKKLV